MALTAKEVEEQFATNVFGLLNVTRTVLPYMWKQRSGHILNFSSIGGYQSGPGFGIYCATKFAVEGLTEALYAELAPLGIHVTAIEPGYFRTDFLGSSYLAVSPKVIDDYAETSGAVRKLASALDEVIDEEVQFVMDRLIVDLVVHAVNSVMKGKFLWSTRPLIMILSIWLAGPWCW
ncbi:hypothetical protein BTJ40_05335 [Microbulbifer sp. A4B17]|uniref:SDR family NAD(P)-dependent oxidoreductase n=1 Tax=Microbulbifer sp. A4B17 TaxID=359370 RepID=UPI000D52EA91|nr:SDR family NAD(P)-dependent oxidoreductase [Microbulbifer sp. A4B17]AWF80279.1 hypothetical protein BTJ40_05335 [Microbulbifer sp. A4B17]